MYYTYMWLREDGTPYYVGKGQGDRACRKGCPPPERIIIQEHRSEQDAFEAEILLIAFYGRKDLGTGILRNRTDGGEGPTGLKFSRQARAKMREAKVGKKNPRHSERMKGKLPWNKGKPWPTALKTVLRQAHLGRHLSIETRQRMSMARKGKPTWNKGRQMSQSFREKCRQRMLKVK